MKHFPWAKKWYIVFFILLTGCHSLQHINSNDESSQNNLEASLIKDIADGRLDMTLEEACLIASGVNSAKKMREYREKMNHLISLIGQETGVTKTTDPFAKAQILFDWLQTNANEGTYKDCYDVRDVLNLKIGNCLSYAVRFTVICRYYGVDVKNVLIPGHIYNLLEINGQTRDFEHTHSDGIVKKMDKDDPMKRVMKDEEVVAEIYLYRARNANNDLRYEESSKDCRLALMFNPHDSRFIILILDNYIAKKNYHEAFVCLNEYLTLYPDDKKSLKNTYNLLQRLDKKGDNKL
ncbi:MAG: transglutaminase-like domain-containing protein [Planctomycetota bacterium]